jgi:hypothetical protein
MRSLLFGVLPLALLACGGDPSTTGGAGGGPPVGCNGEPHSCPMGNTCWLDPDGWFACLPSGDGVEGDDCEHYLGVPTCIDGLVCVQLDGSVPGKCQVQCDPMPNTCSPGVPCNPFSSPNGQIMNACSPPGAGGAGGAGGGGGSGG